MPVPTARGRLAGADPAGADSGCQTPLQVQRTVSVATSYMSMYSGNSGPAEPAHYSAGSGPSAHVSEKSAATSTSESRWDGFVDQAPIPSESPSGQAVLRGLRNLPQLRNEHTSIAEETVPEVNAEERGLRAVLLSQRRIEGALARITSSLDASVAEIRKDISELRDSLGDATGGGVETKYKGIESLKAFASNGANGNVTRIKSEPFGTGSVNGLGELEVRPSSSFENFVAATLPLSWPAVLDARGPCKWASTGNSYSRSYISFRNARKTQVNTLSGMAKVKSMRSVRVRKGIDPSCRQRLVLDFIFLIVALYDVFSIPFLLAYSLPFRGVAKKLSITSTILWVVDLAVNFAVGFYEEGELRVSLDVIAKHYLRTWFMPDALAIVGDLLTLAFYGQLETMAFRLLGLLRILRVCRIVEMFLERTMSETRRLLVRLFVIVGAILLFIHLTCCAFCFLGRWGPSDTGARWTDLFFFAGEEGFVYTELDPMYAYVTTFHEYTSQLTVGNQPLACTNSAERIFNIINLILVLVINCTLVSSLSAYIIEYQTARKDKRLKVRTLQRFLRENKVGETVGMPLLQQVLEGTRHSDRLSEDDVPALALVSSKLRQDLRFELFSRHLMAHPLFRLWMSFDPKALEILCAEAADYKYLLSQDDLFIAGELVDRVYYLVRGLLEYSQDPVSSPVTDTDLPPIEVKEGKWLCEQALYSEWISVGRAEAVTKCQLFTISAAGIESCAPRNMILRAVTKEYSQLFHKHVVSAKPPAAAYPTDLHVPFTDYGDLVTAMTSASQIAIGNEAIDQVEALSWGFTIHSSLAHLRDEVESGTSTVLLNSASELERVVSVVGMRILNEDGMVFSQLGKIEGEKLIANCRLPGGKQLSGELPQDTVRRLLDTLLVPLASVARVDSTERDIVWRVSKQHRVRTKYLRTVCFTRLIGPFEAPSCSQNISSERDSTDRKTKRGWNLGVGSRDSGVFRNAGSAASYVSSTSSAGVVARPPKRSMSGDVSPGMRLAPRRSMTGESDSSWADKVLPDMETFFFAGQEPGSGAFYAWLTKEQFDWMSSTRGEQMLSHFLPTLKFGKSDSFALSSRRPTTMSAEELPLSRLSIGSGKKASMVSSFADDELANMFYMRPSRRISSASSCTGFSE